MLLNYVEYWPDTMAFRFNSILFLLMLKILNLVDTKAYRTKKDVKTEQIVMKQIENQTIPVSKKLTPAIIASLWLLIVVTIGIAVYTTAHKPVKKMALSSLPDLTPYRGQDTTEKTGDLVFNAEKLQTALPRIARHYHMQVVFTSPELQHKKLSGAILKKDDITQILYVLEVTLGIRFKVEDHKILVIPNPYL